MKNKIGWCSLTWNPVWGCLNHCEYCYARKIAKRFAISMAVNELWLTSNMDTISKEIDNLSNKLTDFIPTVLYSQFNKKLPTKPQRIFVGSMSEIYYWNDEWVKKVLEKVKQYPQHIFQFLTKYPDTYSKWLFPYNCWLGVTVTGIRELSDYHLKYYHRYIKKENIKFLSLEPFLSNIPTDFLQFFNWVIIGAETGNRKGKVIPKREWIEEIVNYCRETNIPVYLKDSLKEIYPVEMKEFPKNNL
jgi:protein gp37